MERNRVKVYEWQTDNSDVKHLLRSMLECQGNETWEEKFYFSLTS
jgi:hypothetical protein